jgi:eukaryotic-like serine/threonine-protein kinase
MALAPGSLLGRYRITVQVGAGGMGEVYRAQDDHLQREVAVKVLRDDAVSDPDRQRRFAQEARAASALNHPNILTVHDVGVESGTPYIVTEFIEGEPLSELIARGPVPVRKALEIAAQTAAGLTAAHQAGIVHRDLKPANLILTAAGLVKILDFGLAKSFVQPAGAGPHTGVTATGFVVGTAKYMSPEQVKGEVLDHRTDQFSFGLLLFELLTGKPAFARSTAVSTMAAILEEQAPPVTELNPAVPAPLRWCVERCLAKDRLGRYESTGDLQRELQTILAHLDDPSGRLPAAAAAAAPVPRRSLLWPVLLGVAGLAVGALLVGLFLVPRTAVDLASYRLHPVAAPVEFSRSPVWSGDGKSLAFTAAVNGVRQVFVRELSSSMSGQITNSAADCAHPFWSPDQTRIFYFAAGAAGSDLYAVGATGGAPELVARNSSAAAIAPDGTTLAYLRADPTGKEPLSFWTVNLGGGEPRPFTGRPFDSPKYQSGHLSFAPSGKELGLWLLRWDGASEFWLIDWPGGPARLPFSSAGSAYPFSWMPDSRHIVYGGVARGLVGADLQMADTRDGGARPLTVSCQDAVEASVSADGKRIAFIASQANFDLLSVPLDGSPVQKIPGTSRAEFDPVWSGGSDQIAYSTDRTGASQIWLRSMREGWDRPLVTEEAFGQDWASEFADPNFSPDGRRLAYSVARRSGHSIFISTVAGGKPVRLSLGAADERSPSWNGDGSWIAYLRNTNGNWALVKVPSGGGGRPVVIRERCLPSHPKWNRHNSHWIACVTPEGLTLVSEDGKESRPLSRERWLVYGWGGGGNTLYGVKQVDPRRRVIASLDIGTGVEKTLGELPLPLAAEVRGFSLSPDGKSFATSASHPSGDIWVLEGFSRSGWLPWMR